MSAGNEGQERDAGASGAVQNREIMMGSAARERRSAADEAEAAIRRLLAVRPRLLVAIDGRCGSGKTTLAKTLQERFSCALVHMDDFYLRPEQRTQERLAEPGGNVDRERFLAEVLPGLREGRVFSYRPFDCSRFALGEPVAVPASTLTIVEGSYACHPALRDFYDLRIFLTTGQEEQLRRIAARAGLERAKQFRERWIPLEERYFASCRVQECCDLVLET